MRYSTKALLDLAHSYAELMSGCRKVSVGAVILNKSKDRILSFGANRSIPDLCKCRGCLRIEKYGNNDKTHRGPADCRAIHSEVDAIVAAGCDLHGATIYVTRYPCEACARVIIAAGISEVVYGRQQKISDETADMFDREGVEVTWVPEWTAPDETH